MSDLTERLLSYLKQNAEMMNSLPQKFSGKYKSDFALILDYGMLFEREIKPPPIQGKPARCYQNCYEAMRDHKDLHYCEGYAIHENFQIPLFHAWLVNDSGEVIDPTSTDNPNKSIYFGVVFNRYFLAKRLTKTQAFGVIELDYKLDYEIFKNGFTAEMLNQQFHKF